ncbi:MAG: adenylate kinase [Candidatus Altiarchaeales archaeon]|nr:adenylate kinase [Candidatus Altiarchaeales archaeon]
MRIESKMLVVITGVPGIGKSTTVRKAFEKMGDESKEFEVVNYGNVMFNTAEEEGLVKHRDEMRSLDTQTQHNIQKEAAIKIRQKAQNNKIILDTHATILTPNGYIPGMPKWVLEELSPDVIVIIEANAQDIENWRTKDLKGDFRRRETGNLKGTEQHQNVNRCVSLAYSVFTGTPIKIIEKNEGQLDEAAEILAGILTK